MPPPHRTHLLPSSPIALSTPRGVAKAPTKALAPLSVVRVMEGASTLAWRHMGLTKEKKGGVMPVSTNPGHTDRDITPQARDRAREASSCTALASA